MILVVGGILVGLISMSTYTFASEFTNEDIFERFFHFIRYFGPASLIALLFMLVAELIKLGMAIESHLYFMRHGDEALELNLIASGVSLEETGIKPTSKAEPVQQSTEQKET